MKLTKKHLPVKEKCILLSYLNGVPSCVPIT